MSSQPRFRLPAICAAALIVLTAACTSTTPTASPGAADLPSQIALGSNFSETPADTTAPFDSLSAPSAGSSDGASAGASAGTSPGVTAKPTAKPTVGPTPKPTPGPAVTFEISGLVPQPLVCYVGSNPVGSPCGAGFPPPDYPRELVQVRALDAQGRVATGYTGTLTFENPFFAGETGGLSNGKLHHGVGLFPVLLPDLGLAVSQAPQTTLCPGSGVTFWVRDTVDPSLEACVTIDGGFDTLIDTKAFPDVTPTGCATGCIGEPTGTIVINQNLVAPLIKSIAPTSMDITGETNQGQYFVESVSTGYFTAQAGDMTVTSCDQCTSDTRLYIQRSAINPLNVRGGFMTNDSGFSDGSTYFNLEPTDPFVVKYGWAEYEVNMASVPLVDGFGPTCFSDVALQLSVFCLGG